MAFRPGSQPRAWLSSPPVLIGTTVVVCLWMALAIRHRGGLQARIARLFARQEAAAPVEIRPHPTQALAAFQHRRCTTGLTGPDALFGPTNVWTVHLRFTPEQWEAIQPRRIPSSEGQRGSKGEYLLRNPAASRSGLAGVMGYEFGWTHAEVEVEDRSFPDCGVRYKGNSSFLSALKSPKRPFKIDFNKYRKGQELAGKASLNLANQLADDSLLHDALGYELYREAGVAAPRTAYARVFVTTNSHPAEYLGLYVMVENVDLDFARETLGGRKGALFKPVTLSLFEDLGSEWSNYEKIYDAKGKLTDAQKQRVIDFAKLVSHADDATFAARVGDFLDLDEFTRYLAVTVLLSNHDSFLCNGVNFYLWLPTDSNRFQFLPWDLDNAFGRLVAIGSMQERAELSIDHPWIEENRLLMRLLKIPSFRDQYHQILGTLLDTVFTPEHLYRRIDDAATFLTPLIAEESTRKLDRLQAAMTLTNLNAPPNDGKKMIRFRPPHPLKWFIAERARSVRNQIEGRSTGALPRRMF